MKSVRISCIKFSLSKKEYIMALQIALQTLQCQTHCLKAAQEICSDRAELGHSIVEIVS